MQEIYRHRDDVPPSASTVIIDIPPQSSLRLTDLSFRYPGAGHLFEEEPEITHCHRFPIGIAILEDERKIQSRQQEHACVKRHGSEPFSEDYLEILDRRSGQQFDGAVSLFLGK